MRTRQQLALLLLLLSCKNSNDSPPPPNILPGEQESVLASLNLARWEELNCRDFKWLPNVEDAQWAKLLLDDESRLLSETFPSSEENEQNLRRKTRTLKKRPDSILLKVSYDPNAKGIQESTEYQLKDGSWTVNTYELSHYPLDSSTRLALTYGTLDSVGCYMTMNLTVDRDQSWSSKSTSMTLRKEADSWKRDITHEVVRTVEKKAGEWTIQLKTSDTRTASPSMNTLQAKINSDDQVSELLSYVNGELKARHRLAYVDKKLQSWKMEIASGSTFKFGSLTQYDWQNGRTRMIVKRLPGYDGRDSSIYLDRSGVFGLEMVRFDPKTCFFNGSSVAEECFVRLIDALELFKLKRAPDFGKLFTSAQSSEGIGWGFRAVIPGSVTKGNCELTGDGLDCALRTNFKSPNSLSCENIPDDLTDVWSAEECTFKGNGRGSSLFEESHDHDHMIFQNKGKDRWIYISRYIYDGTPDTHQNTYFFNQFGQQLGFEYEVTGGETPGRQKTCRYSYSGTDERAHGLLCREFTGEGATIRMETEYLPNPTAS